MKYTSCMFCEHANENPHVCPCDVNCYCRRKPDGSCRNKPVTDPVADSIENAFPGSAVDIEKMQELDRVGRYSDAAHIFGVPVADSEDLLQVLAYFTKNTDQIHYYFGKDVYSIGIGWFRNRRIIRVSAIGHSCQSNQLKHISIVGFSDFVVPFVIDYEPESPALAKLRSKK